MASETTAKRQINDKLYDVQQHNYYCADQAELVRARALLESLGFMAARIGVWARPDGDVMHEVLLHVG